MREIFQEQGGALAKSFIRLLDKTGHRKIKGANARASLAV